MVLVWGVRGGLVKKKTADEVSTGLGFRRGLFRAKEEGPRKPEEEGRGERRRKGATRPAPRKGGRRAQTRRTQKGKEEKREEAQHRY